SWKKTMPALDQRAASRHVDEQDVVPRPHPRRHDPVFVDTAAARAASIRVRRGHNGFHRLAPGSYFNTCVLPVWPNTRTTYCAPRRPRMYKLPDEEVPTGTKVRMLLAPSLIGSVPGGGFPGSTGGSPGSTPKSTPMKRPGSRSSVISSRSMPRWISAVRTPFLFPST